MGPRLLSISRPGAPRLKWCDARWYRGRARYTTWQNFPAFLPYVDKRHFADWLGRELHTTASADKQDGTLVSQCHFMLNNVNENRSFFGDTSEFHTT
jgi:hypothetical protein